LITISQRILFLRQETHTPLHVFVSKAFEAVGLFWEDYVVHDKEFVRSQDSCHPQASVNETTDCLGWTATVQMPEPVQRLLKDCKKSDEANYSDFWLSESFRKTVSCFEIIS
jgi:nucleoside-diphosphate-sugar epimerase